MLSIKCCRIWKHWKCDFLMGVLLWQFNSLNNNVHNTHCDCCTCVYVNIWMSTYVYVHLCMSIHTTNTSLLNNSYLELLYCYFMNMVICHHVTSSRFKDSYIILYFSYYSWHIITIYICIICKLWLDMHAHICLIVALCFLQRLITQSQHSRICLQPKTNMRSDCFDDIVCICSYCSKLERASSFVIVSTSPHAVPQQVWCREKFIIFIKEMTVVQVF